MSDAPRARHLAVQQCVGMQATILLLLLARGWAADTDGDGLDDADEVLMGTDPLDADSD
ncbi:MAG: hypothetical protein JRI25_17325, partial [Deltaproteobacteria bacterium]|nr:hypothetical protein [Deltaproteobacteria bacterium]